MTFIGYLVTRDTRTEVLGAPDHYALPDVRALRVRRAHYPPQISRPFHTWPATKRCQRAGRSWRPLLIAEHTGRPNSASDCRVARAIAL